MFGSPPSFFFRAFLSQDLIQHSPAAPFFLLQWIPPPMSFFFPFLSVYESELFFLPPVPDPQSVLPPRVLVLLLSIVTRLLPFPFSFSETSPFFCWSASFFNIGLATRLLLIAPTGFHLGHMSFLREGLLVHPRSWLPSVYPPFLPDCFFFWSCSRTPLLASPSSSPPPSWTKGEDPFSNFIFFFFPLIDFGRPLTNRRNRFSPSGGFHS